MSDQALTSLSIEGLRGCVGPYTLTFEKNKKLTIVYGENGSGKSSLCDGLGFLGSGIVGSLDGRGIGATQKYWHSVGREESDVAVGLATAGVSYRATLGRGGAVWSPTGSRPRMEVLRRPQVLRLIEAQPADRYKEISRFVNVPGIEACEGSLKTLIDTLKKDRASQIIRLQESEDALDRHYVAAGSPGEAGAVTWAREQAARDFSELQEESEKLRVLEVAFQKLSTHQGKWAVAERRLRRAEENLEIAERRRSEVLEAAADDAGEVVEILAAAQKYWEANSDPAACPLCESEENAAGLAERTAVKIASFRSLTEADKALRSARTAHEAEAPELERLQAAYATERDSFRSALGDREWTAMVSRPSSDCPEELSAFDDWYERNKALPDRWRSIREERVQAENDAANVRRQLEAYDENRAIPQSAEELIPNLDSALNLMQAERRGFTDAILSDVEKEVCRLYEKIHPGEGLGKISLGLNPKRRSSLDLSADFGKASDIPPQAYFSESHLDTLGLCLFLALAKKEDPSSTILVIDDVIASADEPHVDRIIEMLYEESKCFRHCIITTHYRPWRNKYRWGWLKNGQCQFIELGKWTAEQGLSESKSTSEIARLRKILEDSEVDIQAACGKAGVILEAILEFLTLHYECMVPRRSDGRYTLGDLLPSLDKRLRKAMYVEVLSTGDDGERKYETFQLGEILDEVDRIAQARNLMGAHFSTASFELPEADGLIFSKKVFELAEYLIDEENGWPRNRKSGSYGATSGETRRLYPYARPTR